MPGVWDQPLTSPDPKKCSVGRRLVDVVSNGMSSEGFQGVDVVHRDHWCRIIIAAFLMLSWSTPLQPLLELQKDFSLGNGEDGTVHM
jgi:hypothetical protein